MGANLNEELSDLLSCGWHVERLEPVLELPAAIVARYPWIPEPLRHFLGTFRLAANATETMWLLNSSEYSGAGLSAYRWNEWEHLEAEALKDEGDLPGLVHAFWDLHLPIANSVKSGYAYFAIRQSDLAVVVGEEPEFQEVTQVAASYSQFLRALAASPLPGSLGRWV